MSRSKITQKLIAEFKERGITLSNKMTAKESSNVVLLEDLGFDFESNDFNTNKDFVSVFADFSLKAYCDSFQEAAEREDQLFETIFDIDLNDLDIYVGSSKIDYLPVIDKFIVKIAIEISF